MPISSLVSERNEILLRDFNKSKDMFDTAMENVYSNVESAISRIEKVSEIVLSMENLTIYEYNELEELITLSLLSLDKILQK